MRWVADIVRPITAEAGGEYPIQCPVFRDPDPADSDSEGRGTREPVVEG
jgi:hypothetical protein